MHSAEILYFVSGFRDLTRIGLCAGGPGLVPEWCTGGSSTITSSLANRPPQFANAPRGIRVTGFSDTKRT